MSASTIHAVTSREPSSLREQPGRLTSGGRAQLALDVRPARDLDPPYDDEVAATTAATAPVARVASQGSLALALDAPRSSRRGRPDLRLVPGSSTTRGRFAPDGAGVDDCEGAEDDDLDADDGLRAQVSLRTPRELLPPPRAWAARLVVAVSEVLSGTRAAAQLAPYVSPDVYGEVEQRLADAAADRVAGRATDRAADRTTGRAATRQGPASQPSSVRPARALRSIHVSEPADGVAEACAVIVRGARMRAIALRLEGLDGRWRCTALHIG